MKLWYVAYFSDYIDNFYSCYHENKQWQEEPNCEKKHVIWEVIFGFPWGRTAHPTLLNSKPRIFNLEMKGCMDLVSHWIVYVRNRCVSGFHI